MYKCLLWSNAWPSPYLVHALLLSLFVPFYLGGMGDYYCLFEAFIYLRFRIASQAKSSGYWPAPFTLRGPNPGGYFGGKFEL